MKALPTVRWITLGALFLIPFLVVYVDQTMYFPFISGKNFAFRMLVEIAFAGWALLALADKKYRPQFSWVMLFYGLLVVWMGIANLFAVNVHKAFWSNFERMDGWITLAHLFLFLVVAGSMLGADRLWKNWWGTFIASTVLPCGYGLLQIMHLRPINQGTTRIDGYIGNAEYFAGYLLFAIAATLWFAFELKGAKNRSWRYTLFVLAALQVIMLIETGTRGTLIGFVVAAAVGALVWLVQAGKNGRRGAAIALAGLVIAVGGFLAIQHTTFVTQNPILSRFSNIGIKDLQVRFTIWHMAYQGFQERPVVGWGQEGFNQVFNKYYDPSLYGQEPWFDRVHDLYLDWLIAGGLPALLLFLAVLGSAVYLLYRGSLTRVERTLVLSALVAYAVQGLVVFDNLFTYIPLVAILAFIHSSHSKPIPALTRIHELSRTTVSNVALPVGAVALILVLWWVNVPTIAQGKDLIHALNGNTAVDTRFALFKRALSGQGNATQEVREQLIQFGASVAGASNIPPQMKSDIVAYAADQMNKELARAPKDVRLRLQLASVYRAAGDYPDAIREDTTAINDSPKKQLLLIDRGTAYWQSGDVKAARADFDQAYQLDTRYDLAANYSIVGHIITNDLAGAKTLMQQRYGTTTVDDPVFVAAYYELKDWNDLIPVLVLHAQNRGDAASAFQVAAAYSESGNRAKAIQVVKDTIAAHPEAAQQGNAYLKQLGAQ